MTVREVLKNNRESVRDIMERYGVERVRLFGSQAMAEESEVSDVDLLVRLETGRDLLDLAGFKLDMEKLLGCKVDVVEEDGLSPYLKDRILNQAVEI